jgi:long-subunit acyl-CoA synthetase (AMP-forming)
MLDAETQRRASNGDRARLETGLVEHLKTLNAALEPHEALAFVAVVRDPWQVSNGLMTPTMKIKRAAIERAYEGELDGWYGAERPVLWQR